MKFLFFAAQYLPTVGGVERYTYNLCNTLAEQKHACTVVTSALPSAPAYESDGGVSVVRLDSRPFMKGRFPLLKRTRAFRRAVKALFAHPYDLAVINTRFYPLSLFAARQCAKWGIPSIIIEHGTKHLSLDNPFLDFFGNLYEHMAMRCVRRYCSDFYGVSAACNAWLNHFGAAAKGVLYNSVDAGYIKRTASESGFDARKAYSLKETAFLVVFSSRFIREKGIFELIEAFEDFRKQEPDAALVMSGDGPLFEELKAGRPEGVYLAGSLPYADNLALIKQADVFILPSYSEGFSTVVLEAAALGACVITTYAGGSSELIENNRSGILLDEVSPAVIAEALLKARRDGAFRLSAGRAAEEKAATRFNWELTAASLLDIASNRKEGELE